MHDVANLQRANVIRAADLFADVAVDLPERIGKLPHFSGANQFTKRCGAFDGDDQAAGIFPRSFREKSIFCSGKKFANHKFSGVNRFFNANIELFPGVGEPADAQRLCGKLQRRRIGECGFVDSKRSVVFEIVSGDGGKNMRAIFGGTRERADFVH